MATIKVRVQGEIATNLTPEVKLVCQNDKYTVEFEFDESWNNSNFKTALFIYNGKSIPVAFDREKNGNTCKIPALYETELLHIGIKSNDVDGLHTSTPARVGCLLSANDISNGEIPNPTPSQYDEIIGLLNQYITGGGSGEGVDLRDYQKKVDDNLQTTDKTVVGAINEVNAKFGQSSGSGITEEQVKEIIQETLPDWAEQEEKPTYTAQEVGALPSDTQLVEQIDASVDEETLSITIDLKDKNGEVVSTKTIVLPISNPDLTEYVKFTDIASTSKFGVVKIGQGFKIDQSNKMLYTDYASKNDIKSRNNYYRPINTAFLDYAVKVGITENKETLTDEEKASACEWIGAVKSGYVDGKIAELLARIEALENK
jgi:hypothetical protein